MTEISTDQDHNRDDQFDFDQPAFEKLVAEAGGVALSGDESFDELPVTITFEKPSGELLRYALPNSQGVSSVTDAYVFATGKMCPGYGTSIRSGFEV